MHSVVRRLTLVLIAFLVGPWARAAADEVSWFPERGIFPRHLADPQEPLFRLTVTPVEDRSEAMLGSPIPVARSGAGGFPWAVSLEAAAFLVLGREGGFFPLRTTDGIIGGDLEAGGPRAMARLRLAHVSAHRADGDTTVSYRGKTVSREFFELEAGFRSAGFFLYGGGGASWHAVPEDPGPNFFAGGTWTNANPSWGPVAAVHGAIDRRRDWDLSVAVFGGVRFGEGPTFRLGARFFDGNRPEGQYDETTIRYMGAEIQYSP